MNKPRILCFAPRSGDVPVADPVALLCAMRLVHQAGFPVKIVQSVKGQNWGSDITALARAYQYLAVSVITSGGILEALEATARYRQANPAGIVIWGGWHCSVCPEETLQSQGGPDFVVTGQGERTMLEFLTGADPAEVLGLGSANSRARPRPLEDVNNFPPIPYELVNLEENIRVSRYGQRTIRYSSSQGCPHRCGFCVEPAVFNRRWSGLKADRVIEELAELKNRRNIDAVIFTDSNFFTDRNRALQIARGLGRLGLKWGDVNGRTRQLLKYRSGEWQELANNGLKCVLVGAESALDSGLELIKKDCTVEDTVRLCQAANVHGIEVVLSMMVGLPYPGKSREELADTAEQEFRAAVALVKQIERRSVGAPNQFLLFTYTPYPNTELWPEALRLGVRKPRTLEEWAQFELCNTVAPWIPKRVARRCELLSGFIRWWIGGNPVAILRNRPLLYPAARAVQAWCRFRWRMGWFGMPLEHEAFKWILKRSKL